VIDGDTDGRIEPARQPCPPLLDLLGTCGPAVGAKGIPEGVLCRGAVRMQLDRALERGQRAGLAVQMCRPGCA
jgi:hypothetical protein